MIRRGWLVLGVLLVWAAPATLSGQRASPWARWAIDQASRGADGVKLGDADGDGRLDVVTGWEEGGVVRLCFQPGPERCRQPWPAVTVGRAPSVEDALLADLDGDGWPEVVSCLEGEARRIQIHRAKQPASPLPPRARRAWLLDAAHWETRPIPATAGVARWMFAVAVQLDGRHGPDLLVGAKNPGGCIAWLEAPADPADVAGWRLHRLRPAGWIMTLRLADLDGDDDPDLLFSDRKGPRRGVFWLENPGQEAIRRGRPWPEHRIFEVASEPMFVDLAGTPGRWRLAAAITPRSVVVAKPGASVRDPWKVEQRLALPAAFGTSKSVHWAAFSGPAPRDLLFTCEHAAGPLSGVGWFPASGSGWGPARDLGGPAGEKFDLAALLDLDGDGDQDVIACEERENLGVFWYENPGFTVGPE